MADGPTALIGFGFTISQVFQKAHEAGMLKSGHAAHNVGLALVFLGIAMLIVRARAPPGRNGVRLVRPRCAHSAMPSHCLTWPCRSSAKRARGPEAAMRPRLIT